MAAIHTVASGRDTVIRAFALQGSLRGHNRVMDEDPMDDRIAGYYCTPDYGEHRWLYQRVGTAGHSPTC